MGGRLDFSGPAWLETVAVQCITRIVSRSKELTGGRPVRRYEWSKKCKSSFWWSACLCFFPSVLSSLEHRSGQTPEAPRPLLGPLPSLRHPACSDIHLLQAAPMPPTISFSASIQPCASHLLALPPSPVPSPPALFSSVPRRKKLGLRMGMSCRLLCFKSL